MTPEERQLITGLFDRMRNHGAPEKDRDAEALILREVRANPDAAYMLVQSVLVQEQALQAANDRVLDLEDQLRATEGGGGEQRGGSGGFLGGGYWGDRRGEQPRASVPQVGSRATPSAYEGRPQSSAWSQQSDPQPQAQQPVPPAASGGGFMKSALTTAAGVAGGMLLAGSIRDMMGGGAHASPLAGPKDADVEEVDEHDTDPDTQDASDDSDMGGGDGEIEV